MSTFDYRRPTTIAEALEMLSRDGAAALSGGTDLVVAMRHRKTRPSLVVDLKAVGDIGDGIEVDGDMLRVGGRVVMAMLTTDDVVRRHFPALARAAAVVGSVQIRNRATLAGNICNASPAADTAPALLAYSAVVTLAGTGGERTVSLDEFFTGPGSTVLAPGEVVVSIAVPVPAARNGSAFARVTRRRGVDLASVSIACVVEPSGRARFGFGAVGPTPLVAETETQDLVDDEGWSRLLAVTSPISDVRAGARYRSAMLEVHSRRAFQVALDQMDSAT